MAKYIWASHLFRTLPDLPLDWSYHRDLENFDEVAILPVKKIFCLNSICSTLGSLINSHIAQKKKLGPINWGTQWTMEISSKE